MGSGSWSTHTYTVRAASKAASGQSTFHYTSQVRSGRAAAQANDLVDPKQVAGSASPFAGKVMREVVITDEHPEPTPIAVVLDVTGSNYEAAVTAHGKMPQLHGLLQRKGYVADPQILFGAVGDAYTDRVPLQFGQFESDNRMDEQLEALYLEGNGGGQRRETYELAAYFLANHTHLEPYEKQGRKGYVFFIGDEMPYDVVRKNHVQQYIGGNIEADVPTEEVFAKLQERYHVFFIFQTQGSYSEREIVPAWRKLLGENVLMLDNPEAVCEVIALSLGLMEGVVDLDEGADDLLEVGADSNAVAAATKALAKVSGHSSGAVATTQGNLPDTGALGATRL